MESRNYKMKNKIILRKKWYSILKNMIFMIIKRDLWTKRKKCVLNNEDKNDKGEKKE